MPTNNEESIEEKGIKTQAKKYDNRWKNITKFLKKLVSNYTSSFRIFCRKRKKKIKIRQKEAYDSLEKDSKGRKISRKKNKVLGRANKIEKILQDNNEIIKLWIEKKLQLKKLWKY